MNKRSSNMELLRIVAMLMIICYHIFYHCINVQLTDINLIAKYGNDWFCHPCFSYKLCILAIISPFGQIGNALFLIISGYFMAHKEKIDLIKTSKKLLFQLGFVSLLLGLVSIYSYHNITDISLNLMQFNSFNYISWYIGYYFTVIVIAKIFLNRFLSKLDQMNYLMFLIVIFAFLQFSWSEGLIASIVNGIEILCTGILLYSLGGYIRKYNPFESLRLWSIIFIIIFINVLRIYCPLYEFVRYVVLLLTIAIELPEIIIGNFYINTLSNILTYDPNSGNLFIQYIPGYLNNQIIPIALAIAIFEIFRRIQISSSRIINFIGSSTFMIYLIHDNVFVYNLWYINNWLTLLGNQF